MNITQAISKAKARLVQKGICENFGQSEVRRIEKKFIDSSRYDANENRKRNELNAFDAWCMNYTGR